ncbi:GLPGLI family protein [Roseivirga pacifica]|uniref:GLPGLI family protein n=1 Tax=Roseivirga pacifica TaxID=1267423 RepID=UPI00227BE063|nr:GLPGLI family protein [Roseivirga pacifica]
MKKLLKQFTLIVGIMVAIVIGANAQNFTGIATYQSSRKMGDFNIKGEGMTPEMQDQLKQRMQKQFQKEYTLKFNLTESLWSEVESLDGGPATVSSGGMMIKMSTGGGATYKNTAENQYLQETEVFSKPFLIDDALISRDWEITSETKKIGNYTAQKAIYTDIRERKMISFSNEGGDDSKDMEMVTDTLKVEAWYTPQIPVSQGPEEYWGLPGLILEVSNGTTSYLCTKVVLNPEDGVDIKPLKKGKAVTREELQAIREEKTQEMMQKYSNGGDGNITIKIGGNE